jgi:outer membrane lipoprotein-sorting protein
VQGRKHLAYWLMAFVLIAANVALAQEQDENDTAKALALVRAAIKARGGDTYLKVRQTITRGQFTGYEKGVSGDPAPFVDYIAPGRERTEFGKGDYKTIQTNSDAASWVYDARAKQIKDQTEEQIKNFKQGARFDLDNLLRAANAQQGVKLTYLGRREPWRSTFSEAIRVEYADGGAATMHFDTRSHLPLSIEYQTVTEKGPAKSETRYFRWVDFGGVMFPTIQDFFLEGVQSARVSFDEVNLNANIPDKLFAKPASIKEVK